MTRFKETKCVMCDKDAEYLADANYKTGRIKELLCEKCYKINMHILLSR